MANDNDMVVRQVGLTFALLASPEKRDVAWVQAHVDGLSLIHISEPTRRS